MKVEYKNSQLEDIERPSEAHKLRLPVTVIKSANRKIRILKDAPDERTLRNWRSLHYEKLKGDKKGFRSIRINDQYRIVFEFIDDVVPRIIIHDIGDYHK